MGLTPIKRLNVSEQVYLQLKENLINGTWKPGDKIPSENELAAAFGISRVSVRQAVQKLTTLGLIETRLGEGSFVKEVTPGVYMNEMLPYIYLGKESTKEVLEFRLITEVETAGLVNSKITEQDIEHLERSLSRMEEYRDDLNKYVKEDLHFHMLISRITGNSLVIQLNYIVRDVIHETIKNITKEVGMNNGLTYHRLIIDAFKERDEEKVKSVMREHLEQALIAYDMERKE